MIPNMIDNNKGFTLIEILIVIGIMAILASIMLVAVNPSRQFKVARDTQRMSNLNALLNAIHENISENKGDFVCNGSTRNISSTPLLVKYGAGYPDYEGDIASCLVPDYISGLPWNPGNSAYYFSSTTDYNTGYELFRDTDGRLVASSSGEISKTILVKR